MTSAVHEGRIRNPGHTTCGEGSPCIPAGAVSTERRTVECSNIATLEYSCWGCDRFYWRCVDHPLGRDECPHILCNQALGAERERYEDHWASANAQRWRQLGSEPPDMSGPPSEYADWDLPLSKTAQRFRATGAEKKGCKSYADMKRMERDRKLYGGSY